MTYNINQKVYENIDTFYENVALKYKHTYSFEQMDKNIREVYDSIYQIENGLLRRKPTISRWKGLFMATSRDRKWNFAYRMEEETIYVEDACHAQNMHESKNVIRLTETQFKQMLVECISKIMKKIV